jgi:hypothetical protein
MSEPLRQQETPHQSPQQNLKYDNEILYQANEQTSKYNQFFNPQDPTVNPISQIKDHFQKALEEQKPPYR